MENNCEFLLKTALFENFSIDEIICFFKAFPPKIHQYKKNEYAIIAGFENHYIGIVEKGSLQAIKENRGGNSFIVSVVNQGGTIGDVLSGSKSKSPVTVKAVTPCTVWSIYYPDLLQKSSAKISDLQRRFLANFILIISDKYFTLNQRIDILLLKNLRQKIALDIFRRSKSSDFKSISIPFSRANWSTYLGCERSALSRELTRMVKDGIVSLDKRKINIECFEKLRALL